MGREKPLKGSINPLIKLYKVPKCTIPEYNAKELGSESRRKAILKELESSGSKILILLGDLPFEYFLSYYSGEKKLHLANYGLEIGDYGKPNPTTINGKKYQAIPLVSNCNNIDPGQV